MQSQRPRVELLKAALSTADVVSVNAMDQQLDLVAELKAEFSAFVARGGVLIAGGCWAERLSEFYLLPSEQAAVDEIPEQADQEHASAAATAEDFVWNTGDGMRLLPNCLLRCVGHEQQTSTNEFLRVLSQRARTVGIVLEPSTMLVLSGRKMYCFGQGKATFCLPAAEHLEAKVESIVQRNSKQRSPWESLVDLTQWRRDAIDRTLSPFPPLMPRTPHVKRGTLLIVGGGGMPPGLMDRFVELAGGPDEAKLVYVPCSEADTVGDQQRTVQTWQKMGVKHATFIHTKDRRRADRDETFLEPLKDATGIWFGGGRQWNFADSYYGTTAHQLMKEVLLRGGVIGGSSAGARFRHATSLERLRLATNGSWPPATNGVDWASSAALPSISTSRNGDASKT